MIYNGCCRSGLVACLDRLYRASNIQPLEKKIGWRKVQSASAVASELVYRCFDVNLIWAALVMFPVSCQKDSIWCYLIHAFRRVSFQCPRQGWRPLPIGGPLFFKYYARRSFWTNFACSSFIAMESQLIINYYIKSYIISITFVHLIITPSCLHHHPVITCMFQL